MEKFNNLMEDIKDALVLSSQRKKLFLPALVTSIIIFVIVIAIIAIVVAGIISLAESGFFNNPAAGWGLVLGVWFAPLILFVLIALFSLILGIIFLIFDVGITGMVIGSVDGEMPTASLFWATVKRHLFPVLFTKIGLGLLIAVSTILWIIPWTLYTLTAGMLTAGWGMIFLSCAIQTLVGFWVLIKIEDQRGGFESIGVNIRFGRNNFWILILIFFLEMKLSSYLPSLLGIIGAILATVFINYSITTFFKIVLLKTYRRYRTDTQAAATE